MKNNTLILFIPYFLILVSCGLKENEKQYKNVELEVTGNLKRIPVDQRTPNVSTGLVSFENLLFNLNWSYNQIQIYDLDKDELIKSLDFEIEGDQGVGNIFGFHVHNLDSIFLFGQMEPRIYLTDTSGLILNRINYNIPDGYSSAFVHPTYFYSPPSIQSGEMIVKTHFFGNYRDVTNDELKNKHMVYSIDLESGNTTLLSHTYPEDYLSLGLKHFEPSIAVGKEKIVYSLFGDHRVFYADSFNESLDSKEAKSSYLDNTLKLFPVDGGRFENQYYMNAYSRYDNLVYDKYRNVFYRFAYPTLDLEDENAVVRLRNAPGPFAILVLNESLDVVGETLFEEGIFLPSNFFVSEEGLYLSINHPDNPENKEEFLSFQQLKLKEL